MSEIISAKAFKVIEGRPVTSSLKVAEYFGKQHKDVLESIRKLVALKPEFDRERNFSLTFEIKHLGNTDRKTPFYWMDRKGFSILAMGFTGAKALDFKCAFYDEFERMEKQLHPQCPAQAQLPAPTLTEQQAHTIMSKVAMRARRDGAKYQTIYRALKERYQVTKYTHIPRDKFEDAIEFIRTVELRTPVVPGNQPEEPMVQNRNITASPEFCETLRRFVWYQRYVYAECHHKFHKYLQLVNSPLAGRYYDMYTSINLANLERQLAKIGFPVSDLECYKRTHGLDDIVAR